MLTCWACITIWYIFSPLSSPVYFNSWIRSLKLGVIPGAAALPGSCQPLVYTIRNAIVEVSNFSWNDKRSRQGRESSILTRSCLSPLSRDGGALGYVVRGL